MTANKKWALIGGLACATAIGTLGGVGRHARLAHADAPAGRYTIGADEDGTPWAKDNRTGLTWKRYEEAGTFTWSSAAGGCLGGWRVPNIRELQSIVDDTRTTPPALDPTAFPGAKGGKTWSSSYYATYGGSVWYLDFDSGYTYDMGAGFPSGFQLRCVR